MTQEQDDMEKAHLENKKHILQKKNGGINRKFVERLA